MIRLAGTYRLAPLAGLVAMLSMAVALLLAAPGAAHADSGAVRSCAVHPVYAHPVTGTVEDPGGASASTTGQAMVDSCVAANGMMEVTDAGRCFLTMRMSLVDLTSNHDFQVQDRGESTWSTPAMGVTGTGSDRNGTTNDVCVELPSPQGIVRVSMLVESMGREVVFYVYADSLSEAAPEGFASTIVTEPSGGGAAEILAGAESAGARDAAASSADAAGGQSGESVADLPEGAGVATAQGLSLSTAPKGASAEAVAVTVPPAVAAVVACVALLAAVAAAVRVFRAGKTCGCCVDPDDYSWEYDHD